MKKVFKTREDARLYFEKNHRISYGKFKPVVINGKKMNVTLMGGGVAFTTKKKEAKK